MSKAKEKQKKIDSKELEAQRLIEEARRREEEERKRQEEIRRYDVIVLPTGLPLILTEYSILEAWKNPKPKDFFIDFVSRYFKKENLSFESIEINIIAEFHLFNLIFAKEELALDDYRTTVLLNIFWQLLIVNNMNYAKGNPLSKSPENSPQGKKLSVMFKGKSLQGDYDQFRDLLLKHTVKFENESAKKIFDVNQTKRIIEFAHKGYFAHYKLYQNILNNKKKNEEIEIRVTIDVPLQIGPLFEALYMGKDKIEVKDEEEEYNREIQEKLRKLEAKKREEEEKLRLEREKKMEEKTLNSKMMKVIIENIKEGEKGVVKEIKDKDGELEKKVDGVLNPKKK